MHDFFGQGTGELGSGKNRGKKVETGSWKPSIPNFSPFSSQENSCTESAVPKRKNAEKSHPVFPVPPGKWIGAILPCIPDYHGPLQIATELGSGNRHLLLLLSPDASPWQHTDLSLEVFFNFCSSMRPGYRSPSPNWISRDFLMRQNDPKCSDVVRHGHPNHFDSRKTTNQRTRSAILKEIIPLEVQPPFFIRWLGVSSSKRNHHFIDGG